jgi:hypothetical protein
LVVTKKGLILVSTNTENKNKMKTIRELRKMPTLLDRRTWREDKNNLWVLEEKQGIQGKLWVLFLEQKGTELKGTRQVFQRLNKELKELFNLV